MSNERTPRSERVVRLSDLLADKPPQNLSPMSAAEYAEYQEMKAILYLQRVRNNYKWPWSKGAVYLYRELIRTLGLEHIEAMLLELAKSKPGRKKNFALANRIRELTREGKTTRQIQKILLEEGKFHALSHEAIESYRKKRRKHTFF